MDFHAQLVKTTGNAVESKPKRYAVVVGVNDYSDTGIGDLSFCSADAEAFYDALLTYCEYDPACIVLFSDGSHKDARKPTRSDILDAVSNMSRLATDKDSVLFFFAGHGTRDSIDSYLLTREFKASIIADTGIPMNTINEYFTKSQARFTMRFFDACHAGRIGSRAASVSPDIKNHFLIQGEGWTTLSACKEDQYAHEDSNLGHGIFSYCLVKGLSGDAATPDEEITLHSLTTYTIEQTINITNTLGLLQTPVTDGYHAGNLVLATLCPDRPIDISPVLVKIQETTLDQLKPTPEKVPQFIADFRSAIQEKPLKLDYVAPSHKEKLAFGERLVHKVYDWCQDQESLYHEQLKGLMGIAVKHQSIQSCPLNLQLAEYIGNLSIKNVVGLEPVYKVERVPSNTILTSILMKYENTEVLIGIREMQGCYNSAVQLTIMTHEPLMPSCGMVIAIIPTSFGLYLLRYSCSTQLDHMQREIWDKTTFAVRALHAIPFTDKEEVKALKELQDVYPQLVSYLTESCLARRIYLQRIGISGQSLI